MRTQHTITAWVTSLAPLQVTVPGADTACPAELSGPYPQSVNGDTNGTLSEVSGITGLSPARMTANTIYAFVVNEGGGNWHVSFYKQATHTTLIGHTATFTTDGAVAVSADGGSGLGGTVIIDNFATIVASTAISLAVSQYTPALGDHVEILVRTPQQPLIRGKAS